MSEWDKQNEEKIPKKRDKRLIYKYRDMLILTFSIAMKTENWNYVCVCVCINYRVINK